MINTRRRYCLTPLRLIIVFFLCKYNFHVPTRRYCVFEVNFQVFHDLTTGTFHTLEPLTRAVLFTKVVITCIQHVLELPVLFPFIVSTSNNFESRSRGEIKSVQPNNNHLFFHCC